MQKRIIFTCLFMLGCDNSIPVNPDKPGGGDGNPDAVAVDEDGDGFDTDQDCDDSNPAVHPEADEVCDLQDNDCDNLVDAADDSLIDPIMAYEDFDNDGFGNPDSPVIVCSIATGVSELGTDCDDDSAEINPDGEEVCDTVDNDCDGLIDDDDDMLVGATTFYRDEDGDGLGNVELSVEACNQPPGFVEDGSDCNDTTLLIGGPQDWYVDNDFDGYGGDFYEAACNGEPGLSTTPGDCDDTNMSFHPDALDYCGDDIDHDCSGPDDSPSSGCTDLEPQDVLGTVSCTGDETTFTVEGDHIRVNYGPSGMWWDHSMAAGLEMMPTSDDDFVDVTYPGVAIDFLMINLNDTQYQIGHPFWADSFETTCAREIAVGDVIGAVHQYERNLYSGPLDIELVYTIEKTELWNKSGRSMLVHLKLQPPGLTGDIVSDIDIQRIIDPDMDYGTSPSAPDLYETTFTHDLGSYFTMASGPSTDWTTGFGACSSFGKTGGRKISPLSLDYPGICNPDGHTEDIHLIYTTEGTATPSEAMERAFILSTGASPEEAHAEWDASKVDYCGDFWDHWMSPAIPDCYDEDAPHEPMEDF